MQKHPKTTNFESLVERLLHEAPVLHHKICKATNLSEDKAKQGLKEVLCFLSLIHFSKQKLTPSHLVDLVWHEFILFTRLYHNYCQKEFGRFIHHQPGGEDNENKRNFKKTLQLYCLYIGEPSAHFWGDMATEMYHEAQCGTDI